MDQHQALQQTIEFLSWGLRNLGYVLVSMGGAVCGYLLYSFPESKRVKQVLKGLGFNGSGLARTEFIVITFMGTFVVATLIQPDSTKAAFLAGFAWLGLLRHLVQNSKSDSSSSSEKRTD